MMKTTSHLTFEKLADLAEDRLPNEERTSSLLHTSGCERCSLQLSRLQHLVTLMRTDVAEDAPRDLLSYANNLFRLRSRPAEPSILQRIVASLTFDSVTNSPAFGVRSSETAARQLIFSAGTSDLELRVVPSGDRFIVSGQLLSEDCGGGQIKMQNESEHQSAALTEFCEFTLQPVPPGNYTLRLYTSEVEIEIPQLKL